MESAANSDPKRLTTVVIADDHPLVRQALRTLLENNGNFKVLAEACNGQEVIKLAMELLPDIVIMDIAMPNINGLEATRVIKEKCPDIIILVLTIYSDSEHILGILDAGASGYLTKGVFGEEVITAINSLLEGETVLSDQVLKEILKNVNQPSKTAVPLNTRHDLNWREMGILKMIAKGMSNKDIAQKSELSLQTVKGYSANIFLQKWNH